MENPEIIFGYPGNSGKLFAKVLIFGKFFGKCWKKCKKGVATATASSKKK